MEIQSLEQLLESFYRISGMGIAAFDRKNHCIAVYEAPDSYCKNIVRGKKLLDECIRSDTNGFRLAEEQLTPVTYVCPFGIHEMIVPLIGEEGVAAYLIVNLGLSADGTEDSIPLERALELSPDFNRDLLARQIRNLPHFTEKKEIAVRDLLSLFASYIVENNLLPDTDWEIAKIVRRYLSHNFDRKITLSDLSKKLHCSTVTLTQNFRKSYGITILEYLTKKRMAKAETLLCDPTLSVAVISELCGFSDPEYFSKCFRAAHGASPTAWRSAHITDK